MLSKIQVIEMKRISVLLLLVILAVGSVWRYSLPLDYENLILYYFFEEISGNQVVEITVSDHLNFNVD